MLIGGKARVIASGSTANQSRLKAWDVAVREAARDTIGEVDAPPFVRTALVFTVLFRLARPAGHWGRRGLLPSAPRHPIGKPDGDKLARQAADSLACIVFDDDARIVSWRIDKVYAAPGHEGASFEIEEAFG
ncbi:MAG: RusA family crossover junction endodeoxyribonuclease [Chloroflexi bacterium]|nr:RusA family crossover junction endodeoxyribonuclease [Chloroflexota bacterium]